MNRRYRVWQDFITRRWYVCDQWQLNEVGARIVARDLTEDEARRLAALWNAQSAAARNGTAA